MSTKPINPHTLLALAGHVLAELSKGKRSAHLLKTAAGVERAIQRAVRQQQKQVRR